MTGDPALYGRRTAVPAHVLVRPVADELVLLSLESEEYFGLDPVAARLWQLLDGAPTVQHAFDAMLAEFEVDPETLGRDLEELIGSLTSRRLLELVEADGPE